jgi:hypothetical protein
MVWVYAFSEAVLLVSCAILVEKWRKARRRVEAPAV